MDWDKFLDALDFGERDGLRAALQRRSGATADVLNSQERALALCGNKIGAIRALRDRTHIGLIEAKTIIEQFLSVRSIRTVATPTPKTPPDQDDRPSW